jgi:RNA polymerase sigma factor (sigma-70 family)
VATSDTDLIVRVLERDDRHAFAELVRRHQSAVRTLLRRLTGGDRARADDLAQETFLRAYRGLRGYQGGARLSTWLHRIAYRLYLDDLARNPRPGSAPPALGSPEHSAATSDAIAPHRVQSAALLRHDLEGALRLLPEAERAALAVVYGAELTHEEAARVLGCPLGTLKTNVARAKERLRDWLAAWDDGQRSADGT